MSLLGKSAPSTVVGLDIGSNLIKVAEAKAGKKAINLTGIGVAPVPEGVYENGVVVDPQGLGQAIKKLLADSGIKAKTVVTSLSGQASIVVRVIEMPKMTPKELGEAIKFEVERQMPFAPTEAIFDYAPLEKPSADPDAQQMEVLLAAAQQDIINGHLDSLFAAGMKPYAIDVELLASGRALIDASDNGALNATVAIVNIGANKTDVGIYEGGLLTFPSPPLQIAGINLTRAISEAFNISIESAELLKKQHAEVDLNRIDSISGGYSGGDVGFSTMGQTEEESDFDSPINFIGADSGPGPIVGGPTVMPPSEPPSSPLGGTAFGSPFDFGEPDEKPEEQPAPFRNTVDGPVFDVDGEVEVPPVKPSFDLSEDLDTPASPPPGFAPADEPEAQPASETTAFKFDLSDEDEAPVFGTGEPKPAAQEDVQFAAPDDEGTGEPQAAGMSGIEFEPADETESASGPIFGEGTGEPKQAGVEWEATQSVSADEPLGFGGVDQSTKQQVFEAIAPVLVDLAGELRRTVEYYRTRFQNAPEKIFITGGTALIKNLDKFLSNELGIPVEVADPVKNLGVTSARYSDQYLREISPLFSVSIGLAIRDML